MRSAITTAFSAFALLAISVEGWGPAQADSSLAQITGSYRLTPQTVEARFSIKRLAGSPLAGSFLDVRGAFTIDGADPAGSHIHVTIAPASVSTGSERRDAMLRGAGFFDVARYPQARFVSQQVRQTGPRMAQVRGLLTVRDTVKPIELSVELFEGGPRPSFRIEGAFFRSQFGMNAGQPFYGDLVRVEILATGIPD
jgi:polyisoprenoid-binding protein YceI